jgi:hypothetical protein
MTTQTDFIIMGAVKGGTSTMYQHLKAHPEIATSIIKETNFFSEYYYDYERYHNMFYFVDGDRRIEYKVAGEASPNYLAQDRVPERIHRYNPNMKLIYILRDPCDRAYSHYMMHKDKYHIHQYQDIKPFLQEMKKSPEYIEAGLYAKSIKNMLKYFPKEQCLFLKYEDLAKDAQKVMKKVFGFLGVIQKNVDASMRVGPAGVLKRKPWKLKRRKTLLKYFIDDIEELEKLLNWDLKNWKCTYIK